MIRKATLEDIERGLVLCKKLYPGRPVHLGIPWIIDCMRRADRLVLVSDHGVGVATGFLKYGWFPMAQMEILAVLPEAPKMEAVRFLRTMIAWAKANGAKRFLISADSGIDLGPLARRVGGRTRDTPHYYVPLQE
jgi:hypothetical protein